MHNNRSRRRRVAWTRGTRRLSAEEHHGAVSEADTHRQRHCRLARPALFPASRTTRAVCPGTPGVRSETLREFVGMEVNGPKTLFSAGNTCLELANMPTAVGPGQACGPQMMVVLLALLPCGPSATRAPLVRVRGLRRARIRGRAKQQAAKAAQEWSRALEDSEESKGAAPLVRLLLRRRRGAHSARFGCHGAFCDHRAIPGRLPAFLLAYSRWLGTKTKWCPTGELLGSEAFQGGSDPTSRPSCARCLWPTCRRVSAPPPCMRIISSLTEAALAGRLRCGKP